MSIFCLHYAYHMIRVDNIRHLSQLASQAIFINYTQRMLEAKPINSIFHIFYFFFLQEVTKKITIHYKSGEKNK